MMGRSKSGRIVKKGEDLKRKSIAEDEVKDSEAVAVAEVVKKGFLEKLSRGALAGYQKRFFVLQGSYLKYYKGEACKCLLAAVDVRPLLVEVGSDPRMKGRTLSLRLAGEENRFVLRARDEGERDAWLKALAAAQAEAKRDGSVSTFADTDSLQIVVGGTEAERADRMMAGGAQRAAGRTSLESPRDSSLSVATRGPDAGSAVGPEARGTLCDGRNVSSLTAASVVVTASSCDTSLLTTSVTTVATPGSKAPGGDPHSFSDAPNAEPIHLHDSLSQNSRSLSNKAPPAAPRAPPQAAARPPCLTFFGC